MKVWVCWIQGEVQIESKCMPNVDEGHNLTDKKAPDKKAKFLLKKRAI